MVSDVKTFFIRYRNRTALWADGDIYFSSLLPDFSADLTKKSRYLRRRKKSVFYFVVKSNFLLTFLWAGFGPCEKPCFFNHYLIKNYPKNGEYLTQMQTRNFPPLLSNFDNSIDIPNLETIFFRYTLRLSMIVVKIEM